MAVPLRTWRIAPTQLNASQAARSTPHGGREPRGSSTSSWTIARVAAAPPATAVRISPPDSTAVTAAATPNAATVPSCHGRGWSVSRVAAGTRTIRPKANPTASSRRSVGVPKPTWPSPSSCVDRTGAHNATSARIESHAPAARTTRSIFQPATPQMATAPAVARGMATGAMSAIDGMRALKVKALFQPLDCGPQLIRSRFLLRDDLLRRLRPELGIFELGLHAIELLLQVGFLLCHHGGIGRGDRGEDDAPFGESQLLARRQLIDHRDQAQKRQGARPVGVHRLHEPRRASLGRRARHRLA